MAETGSADPKHPETNDGLAARVARTRLGGALLACWRAAAYDPPDERTPTGWTKLGVAVMGLAFALAVGGALAVIAVEPVIEATVAPATDAVLSMVRSVLSLALLVLWALVVMYLGKLLALVPREVS